MKVLRKSKDQIVLKGNFKKISKRYLGFYLPKEIEKEFGKTAIATIKIVRGRKTKNRR